MLRSIIFKLNIYCVIYHRRPSIALPLNSDFKDCTKQKCFLQLSNKCCQYGNSRSITYLGIFPGTFCQLPQVQNHKPSQLSSVLIHKVAWKNEWSWFWFLDYRTEKFVCMCSDLGNFLFPIQILKQSVISFAYWIFYPFEIESPIPFP